MSEGTVTPRGASATQELPELPPAAPSPQVWAPVPGLEAAFAPQSPAFLTCLLLTFQILSFFFFKIFICVCVKFFWSVCVYMDLQDSPYFPRNPAMTKNTSLSFTQGLLYGSWKNAFRISFLPPAGNGSVWSPLILCVFLPVVRFGQKLCTASTASVILLTPPASLHTWQKSRVLK